MSQRFDLSGKVALVTGGSRGLGRAIALGLAEAGADLIIASRKLPNCEAVAKEVEALGRQALPRACHVGRLEELEPLLDASYERFGRLDILVNNAGINPAALPLTEATSELFDKLYAVNVKGPLFLASGAARRMAEAGGGVIINVITQGVFKPGVNLGIYCSSKAALLNLTNVMAQEWGPLGVRVNALAPGPFMTDMMRNAEQIPGFVDQIQNSNVMKRIAEPAEIVGSVLFLASEASGFVTGQTLVVDGGILP